MLKDILSGLTTVLKNLFQFLVVSAVALLFFLGFCIPIWISRFFVVFLARSVRPDLEDLVTGLDSLFKREVQNSSSSETTLLVIKVIEPGLRVEKVRKFYDDKSKEWKYRILRQYVEPWMGFVFRKTDMEFNIDNHVNYFEENNENPPNRDEEWLQQTKKYLFKKPFHENRSPWEILIVPGYKPQNDVYKKNYSILILRIDHSLSEYATILKLSSESSENTPVMTFKTKPYKNNCMTKIFQMITLLFSVPYKVTKFILSGTDDNKTPWCSKNTTLSGKISSATSEPIALKDLTSIRHDVSLVPVIFAGITAGLRNLMMEKNVTIPEAIYCNLSVPETNCFTKSMDFAYFPLPVAISDPRKRLQLINLEYRKLKSFWTPMTLAYFTKLLRSLPYWVKKKTATSIAVSNSIFSCSVNEADAHGSPIKYIYHSAPVPHSYYHSGIVICCSIFYGKLTIDVNVDHSILESDQLVKKMMQFILNEFRMLNRNSINI